jgi:hypothetical protein
MLITVELERSRDRVMVDRVFARFFVGGEDEELLSAGVLMFRPKYWPWVLVALQTVATVTVVEISPDEQPQALEKKRVVKLTSSNMKEVPNGKGEVKRPGSVPGVGGDSAAVGRGESVQEVDGGGGAASLSHAPCAKCGEEKSGTAGYCSGNWD